MIAASLGALPAPADAGTELVRSPLESQTLGDGTTGLPRRREPDLTGLATFVLDLDGRVASWSASATRLFGHPVGAVAGHHVCDVLMTGAGQSELVRAALAEVGQGRVWTATVAGGDLGEGRFAIRCEPLAGGGDSALVVVQRASPQPSPRWLSEAVARIGGTLDLTQTASEVVDVAVPGFADAAVIYVAERLLAADDLSSLRAGAGVTVRRLAARLAVQVGPAAGSVLPAGEVLLLGEHMLGSRAMMTGEPVVSGSLDVVADGEPGRGPAGWEIAAGLTSFLAVPLIARGAIVGCAVFGRTLASPAFSPGEIVLAGELASRAAVCIDNARLYNRERRTALALQQGLLPAQPRIPAGMEVGRVYLPVGASVVGGDWHDIVPLPGGEAALIVGDAMGHGPEAAAVMVQLRTAAHTLADLGLPAEEVLRRLDRLASGMATAPFATCIYAVIDPAGSSCVVAQAGHLPPILVLPGGETQVLGLPPGLPLGLGGDSFAASQISLPPGATLALYTDGLVESRARSLDDGLAALQHALSSVLASPGGTLEDACAKVTGMLREHGEDDITLVLARVAAPDTAR
jgi:stage II sporulation SpoE-like protein/GAF domain-containing protein